MVLSLLVALLIILVALYLSTQGMLSSLLALATSIFASVLAMALLEATQGAVGSWRPVYARGITFLALFLIIFSGTRIAADMAVPKNIKLPNLVNRVLGGFIGFFAGLVVVGTLLIGLEMLPVGRVILGYDRFPDAHHMQAVDSEGRAVPGKLAPMRNVFFAPDRFVLAIYSGASRGGIGLTREFLTIHPDFSVESYGYRNEYPGSTRVLVQENLAVQGRDCAWLGTEQKLTTDDGVALPEPGRRLLMVRTEIQKGSSPSKMSNDPNDTNLRITPSQVRLVTNKGRQYYPVGYMEGGAKFVFLPLDSGFLVDDYVKGIKAVEDWIFQLADDEIPAAIEVKQLARAELSDPPKDRAAAALAATEYPPHAYYKDVGSLTVTFDPTADKSLKAARVYVLKPEMRRDDIPTSILSDAKDHVLKCVKNIADGVGGWTAKGAPGVPSEGAFLNARNYGPNILNAADSELLSLNAVFPMLLLGQTEADGNVNLRNLPEYFDKKIIVDLLQKKARRGNFIIASGVPATDSGKCVFPKISAGRHPVIITMQTDTGFYVWINDNQEFKAGATVDLKVVAKPNSGYMPTFHIDLDEKAP